MPVGVFGTLWAYRKLRDDGERHRGRIDWWGNVTFAVGLGAVLIGITNGVHPYKHDSMGWANPSVYGSLIGGVVLLIAFAVIESRIAEPMFAVALFRIRAFTAGNIAGLTAAVARGGLQFVLIIWLQGIWLPLHGYDFERTPLWAGIFLLPMTAGFLIAGPISGHLSDRYGARGFRHRRHAAVRRQLHRLDADPDRLLLRLVRRAHRRERRRASACSPRPTPRPIMSSVPARQRGAASGMRSTFQNSGTALSIGIFFSLIVAGLSSTLSTTLTHGLAQQGVSAPVAHQVGALPPVASLFAAILGVNPIQHLLAPTGALTTLPPANQQTLTGRTFFPHLISQPFHDGLVVVFSVAAGLALIGAIASLLRGGRYVHEAGHGPRRRDPQRADRAVGGALTTPGLTRRQNAEDSPVMSRRRRAEAAHLTQTMEDDDGVQPP